MRNWNSPSKVNAEALKLVLNGADSVAKFQCLMELALILYCLLTKRKQMAGNMQASNNKASPSDDRQGSDLDSVGMSENDDLSEDDGNGAAHGG